MDDMQPQHKTQIVNDVNTITGKAYVDYSFEHYKRLPFEEQWYYQA